MDQESGVHLDLTKVDDLAVHLMILHWSNPLDCTEEHLSAFQLSLRCKAISISVLHVQLFLLMHLWWTPAFYTTCDNTIAHGGTYTRIVSNTVHLGFNLCICWLELLRWQRGQLYLHSCTLPADCTAMYLCSSFCICISTMLYLDAVEGFPVLQNLKKVSWLDMWYNANGTVVFEGCCDSLYGFDFTLKLVLGSSLSYTTNLFQEPSVGELVQLLHKSLQWCSCASPWSLHGPNIVYCAARSRKRLERLYEGCDCGLDILYNSTMQLWGF